MCIHTYIHIHIYIYIYDTHLILCNGLPEGSHCLRRRPVTTALGSACRGSVQGCPLRPNFLIIAANTWWCPDPAPLISMLTPRYPTAANNHVCFTGRLHSLCPCPWTLTLGGSGESPTLTTSRVSAYFTDTGISTVFRQHLAAPLLQSGLMNSIGKVPKWGAKISNRRTMAYPNLELSLESSKAPRAGPIFPDWCFEHWLWDLALVCPDPGQDLMFQVIIEITPDG